MARPPKAFAWLLGAALIGSVALLGACSSTRLLYDNLDWLLYRGLDKRFDISAEQRPWLKDRLRELHQWHRETQLPLYDESLRELARRFGNGLNTADFQWLDDRIEAHRHALVARIIPDFARFLTKLDNSQIAHYAEFAAASLAEAAEPLALSVEDRLDRRVDEFTERLSHWTGDLDRIQQDALRDDLANWPDFRRDWLAQRQTRQQTFVALLRANPPQSAIEDHLTTRWLDLRASYPQEYWERRQAAKRRLFRVLWAVEQRLSEHQRTRFLERIGRYNHEIRRLTHRQT